MSPRDNCLRAPIRPACRPGTALVGLGFCLVAAAASRGQAAQPATVERAFTRVGDQETTTVLLGSDLYVEVRNLKTLVESARSAAPPRRILLFLDGKPLPDVTPFPPTDPDGTLLVFPLTRTERSRDAWTAILGKPGWETRDTAVSIGWEGGYALGSTARIQFQVLPHGWFAFWLLLFAVLMAGFLVLAVQSDILRESGPAVPAGQRKPYSLGRTQAAWWFFIVLAAYLFIGMVTGDFSSTITGSVLILLGISAGTVVGAAVIDVSKDNAAAARAAAAGIPLVPAVNECWLLDILSDRDGVSFHRFQIAAWTLVLGIIFVAQVYRVLAMPTFGENLLALTGISAGTYLGLKIPEPK